MFDVTNKLSRPVNGTAKNIVESCLVSHLSAFSVRPYLLCRTMALVIMALGSWNASATQGAFVIPSHAMKIYPRNSEMGSRYSGCQTIWFEQGTLRKKFSLSYYEKGMLKLFLAYGDESMPDGMQCTYQEGQLVAGATKGCPDANMAKGLATSFPAGCMQAIAEGKSKPKDCQLEKFEAMAY